MTELLTFTSIVTTILDWLIDLLPKLIALSTLIAAFFPRGALPPKVFNYIDLVAFNIKNATNKH